MSKIIASSLDNFIVINTSNVISLPYVTFTIGTIPSSGVSITITDANDENGYNKVIIGTSSGETTSNSFNTDGECIYTLMECLRMNSIFYGISIVSSTMIKAMLDTSFKYNIVSSNGITIGGNYSSYSPSLPNKSVLIMQESGNTDNSIVMEKYHNVQTVSFNITSPFQKTTYKTPLDFNLYGYTLSNGTAHSANTSPYTQITVMPTTLSKFQGVDYDNYLYTGGTKTNFLTTQTNRYYNYNEWVCLSILSTSDTIEGLKKNYYTNSGVFLESQYTTQYIEKNNIRYDIYDTFELNEIEARHDKQVGYILVYGWDGNKEITEPIKFEIMPHCDGNNEIFFLNEIGGIDSFNFTNTKSVSRTIGSQTTYNINHIRPYTTEYEHQYIKAKRDKIITTLSSNHINQEVADWLNQLVKSKYTFKFLGMVNPRYKMIVVDKFEVTTSTANDEFEVSLEYYDSDNEISA